MVKKVKKAAAKAHKSKKRERERALTSEIGRFALALVRAAFAEDVGSGDITTGAIVGQGKRRAAEIVAKEGLTVAGHMVAKAAFKELDPKATYQVLVKDGERAKRGEVVCVVRARLDAILTAERVALNFVQRLSGIATLTSDFVKKTASEKATILDTRKTTPCLRVLERYAVRMGGAANHRFGLFDAVLIKDNHIAASGSVAKAISKVKAALGEGVRVEVEVRTLTELKEALAFGVDIILLDNMTPDSMARAVKITSGRALLEASGSVTLGNVREVAKTGVDFISVGALTHSARSVDLSLRLKR